LSLLSDYQVWDLIFGPHLGALGLSW